MLEGEKWRLLFLFYILHDSSDTRLIPIDGMKTFPPSQRSQKHSSSYRSFNWRRTNSARSKWKVQQTYPEKMVTCTHEWALNSLSSRLFVEYALFICLLFRFLPLCTIIFNHLVTNLWRNRWMHVLLLRCTRNFCVISRNKKEIRYNPSTMINKKINIVSSNREREENFHTCFAD